MNGEVRCRICGESIKQYINICVPVSGMKLYDNVRESDCLKSMFYYCPKCYHGHVVDMLGKDYYRTYQVLSINGENCTDKYYVKSFVDFVKSQVSYAMEFCVGRTCALDIGCADGTLSQILQDDYSIVDGVEVSDRFESFKANGKLMHI